METEKLIYLGLAYFVGVPLLIVLTVFLLSKYRDPIERWAKRLAGPRRPQVRVEYHALANGVQVTEEVLLDYTLPEGGYEKMQALKAALLAHLQTTRPEAGFTDVLIIDYEEKNA